MRMLGRQARTPLALLTLFCYLSVWQCREAAEKEAAQARYWKLHQEGKTDQAKADMARLAVIRKKREEAAAQRLAEAQGKILDTKKYCGFFFFSSIEWCYRTETNHLCMPF